MLLSPLDLLQVSASEQDVIRCLVRRPFQTKREIARRTRIPLRELDQVLSQMVRSAKLILHDESELRYSVQISPKGNTPRKRPSGGLLDSFFN
ncbi:MAG: hypothetical protein ACPG8W_00255 [Candidatus Promineifilaceae bacterium]